MLAPRELPEAYARWNRRRGAPFGRRTFGRRAQVGRVGLGVRYLGAFAWQPNNSIRRFEYPWVWDQVRSQPTGAHMVEVGGSLGGLQFVLAREGYRVTNVDPGLAASGRGWAVDPSIHARLCRQFRAPVELRATTIGDAGLADSSVDVLISVSTLEHLSTEDLREFCAEVPRILRPDGLAVLTVDLFLDLVPFTSADANKYGRNVDVRALLDDASLELVQGEPSELHGYPEFDADRIQRNLASYLVGDYPALAQCLVARPR